MRSRPLRNISQIVRYETYQLLLINRIREPVTSAIDCAPEQLGGAATAELNPTFIATLVLINSASSLCLPLLIP